MDFFPDELVVEDDDPLAVFVVDANAQLLDLIGGRPSVVLQCDTDLEGIADGDPVDDLVVHVLELHVHQFQLSVPLPVQPVGDLAGNVLLVRPLILQYHRLDVAGILDAAVLQQDSIVA